jgi:hypothetical protein
MIDYNSKFTPYIDVLSEPSINMMRLYLIIRELQHNKNRRLVMTLEKLCFFNCAIVSDDIVNSILIKNNKIKSSETPKRTEEGFSYSNRHDIKEAIQGGLVKKYSIQLSSLNIININFINNEKLLSIKNSIEVNENDPLICKWKENLKKLKFCVSKPERELYSFLIEAAYE